MGLPPAWILDMCFLKASLDFELLPQIPQIWLKSKWVSTWHFIRDLSGFSFWQMWHTQTLFSKFLLMASEIILSNSEKFIVKYNINDKSYFSKNGAVKCSVICKCSSKLTFCVGRGVRDFLLECCSEMWFLNEFLEFTFFPHWGQVCWYPWKWVSQCRLTLALSLCIRPQTVHCHSLLSMFLNMEVDMSSSNSEIWQLIKMI